MELTNVVCTIKHAKTKKKRFLPRYMPKCLVSVYLTEC